jgi:hypothetical protein
LALAIDDKHASRKCSKIDDTFRAMQAISNLHFGTRITTSFIWRQIYHTASGTLVVTILVRRDIPKGPEVRTIINHVKKRVRRH